MNIPEGWPTEEMVKAVFAYLSRSEAEFTKLDIKGAIRAALVAAPICAEVAGDEAAGEIVRLRAEVDRLTEALTDMENLYLEISERQE